MATRVGTTTLFAAISVALAGYAQAQAWPVPPHVGSLSLVYQRIDNTGHRLSDGSLLPAGNSLSQGLAVDFSYGITSRLSVSAGVPYIGAKYTYRGPIPSPAMIVLGEDLPVDAGHQWQSSFQDFGLSARYNAVARGPLVITPAVNVVLPSHAYNYRGEAVVGRRLKEVQITVSAARTLEEITPRLEITAGYGYALVERAAVDVPNNRSNASLGMSYSATPRLGLHGNALWQRTHGGLSFGDGPGGVDPGDINTPARFAEHDRLLRDNSFHLEGGLSYALGTMDVFVNYLHYVSGTDTHAGHAFTVGATWYFGALPGRAPHR